MDQGSVASHHRFQVRLRDLFLVVIGASYVLDVARRSMQAWGGGRPDFAHSVGFLVLTLAVAMFLVLAVHQVGRMSAKGGLAWIWDWRFLALGWLVGSIVELSATLQAAPDTARIIEDLGVMRLRLAAFSMVVGMVGLMLVLLPLRDRPIGSSLPPRRKSWPAVVLASGFGLIVLTLVHGMVPYLILLALEAVQNAMRMAPLIKRPIVFDRMFAASLEAIPGLVGCLLTACWVDDDLREAVRDPVAARVDRSWLGLIARVATTILAGSGAAYVWLLSIPKLSPFVAEALAIVVRPSLVATVSLGFAVLAAGFSARSAARLAGATPFDDRPAPTEVTRRGPGRWVRRIVAGIVALACLEIIAAAVLQIRADADDRWYVPVRIDSWLAPIRTPPNWFGYPLGLSLWDRLLERPDDFLIGFAVVWMTIRLAGVVGRGRSAEPAPIERIATDRLAIGRFLGWWVALSIAMLASLPTLAVVAVSLMHFVIHWMAP